MTLPKGISARFGIEIHPKAKSSGSVMAFPKGRLNAAEWEFRRAWRGQVIVAQLAENIFCLLGVI
jgi:hypothetical protein